MEIRDTRSRSQAAGWTYERHSEESQLFVAVIYVCEDPACRTVRLACRFTGFESPHLASPY